MFTPYIVFVLLLKPLVSSEQECSKYHYEEKSLEKIIEMDFSVKQMKTQMDTLHDQVEEMLISLAREKQNLNLEWKKHKELLNSQFDEMKKINDRQMSLYAEAFQKMNESTIIPTVAFLGKDVTNRSPGVGQKFVFKTTMFNEGNGYDNRTGIFTAPVAGTYLFHVQFCVDNGRTLPYEIVSGGKVIKRGWFYNKDANTCDTTDALAVLKAGVGVWVKLVHSATSLHGSLDGWNSFSGTIVHK